MSRLLILDLDGTLVDSLPDLRAALNRALAAHGCAPLSAAEVARMIGDGTRRLVERGFAAQGRGADDAAVAAFMADYLRAAAVETRLYPEAAATLDALAAAGWRCAICTNKPLAATERILAALGMAGRFAAIGAGDSFPARKPDPRHLLATIAAAGGAPGRAVMVGDHANDLAAAAGAGVPAVFAAWGYGPMTMAAGAAAVAERFRDLAVLAPRLVP
jgi:phosphoglycolate phosphatase